MNTAEDVHAARNLAQKIGRPPSGSALLVCSATKREFAGQVAAALKEEGVAAYIMEVPGGQGPAESGPVRRLIHEIAPTWGLGFLIAWQDAGFLFDIVGRPDTGMKICSKHFFSDFCMSLSGFIRINSADPQELERYKAALLASLRPVPPGNKVVVEVTTPAGTRVSFPPRNWNVSAGEVFTAPVEGLVSGVIVVDGCAYSGPPKKPFALKLEGGQVANLAELDRSDDQQNMVFTDLTRDRNAATFAEFGIGVNPEASVDADLMESEQARGTCHFGFGHNIEYGGMNASLYHFDLVVRRPTITVAGLTIVENGTLRAVPNV